MLLGTKLQATWTAMPYNFTLHVYAANTALQQLKIHEHVAQDTVKQTRNAVPILRAPVPEIAWADAFWKINIMKLGKKKHLSNNHRCNCTTISAQRLKRDYQDGKDVLTSVSQIEK